jgi:hypothetical protein
MYLHTYAAERLIRQRERELAGSAERHGRIVPSRERTRRSLRYRAGWALIEIGLALARDRAMPDARHYERRGSPRPI